MTMDNSTFKNTVSEVVSSSFDVHLTMDTPRLRTPFLKLSLHPSIIMYI